jgi:hypothetical protein
LVTECWFDIGLLLLLLEYFKGLCGNVFQGIHDAIPA